MTPHLQPRTLSDVLADVREARRAFDQSWHKPNESDALDRLHGLQCEGRSMIERLTGVSMDDIGEVA